MIPPVFLAVFLAASASIHITLRADLPAVHGSSVRSQRSIQVVHSIKAVHLIQV
jgi:hypothetical protein